MGNHNMNVLCIDQDRVGLDFAMRCEEAGHNVKLFTRPTHFPDKTGAGLVERVSDWRKWMQWANVIVPTSNGQYLDQLEGFRKYGYPIFGPSKASADLEISRAKGMELFRKCGIDIPPYKMFRSFDEAEAHCWKHDERYVFKTMGDNEDKSLSYVAKDAADMISTLRRWKKMGKNIKGPCMLQTFIPGIEMGVSAWMGKEGFLAPRGENAEHKKLKSGDYGPNTGEEGTVMWYAEDSKLARDVLDPLEKDLLALGHRGDIDVNCIIDEKGKAWPLEFTCRLGWPAFFLQCAQHEEPVQWMRDALDGKDTLRVSQAMFSCVVVTIPPYPSKHIKREDVEGIPIRGITQENFKNVHLVSVMTGRDVDMVNGKPVEKDMFKTAGEYVLVVNGQGPTVKTATKRMYEVVDQIHLNNMQVRDDIGEKFAKTLPQLHELGYAIDAKP